MGDWDNNEIFEVKFSRKQVHEIITEYYRKYHNFNGEIKFKLYYESKPDGWGFYDDFGRMDLVFIEKVKIFNEEVTKTSTIKYKDLRLSKIFAPILENEGYELTSGVWLDIDVYNYGRNIRFKSASARIKKKEKEKVLKK